MSMDHSSGAKGFSEAGRLHRPGEAQTDGKALNEPGEFMGAEVTRSGAERSHIISEEGSYHLRAARRQDYREKARARKVSRALTYLPVKSCADGSFQVDPQVVTTGFHAIDFTSLKACSERLKTNDRVTEGESKIDGAGTGAIALKSFSENEIVGFYEGELTHRKRLPDTLGSDYETHFNIPHDSLASSLYVVWSGSAGEAKFKTAADTYIAWTGVKVDGKNIELGIDGREKINNLSYINHSNKCNCRLIPVTPAEHGRVTNSKIMYLNADALEPENLMLVLVADKPINEGEELTFRYAPTVSFDSVGCDIIQYPEHCTHFVDGDLRFLKPAQWQSLQTEDSSEEPSADVALNGALSGDDSDTSFNMDEAFIDHEFLEFEEERLPAYRKRKRVTTGAGKKWQKASSRQGKPLGMSINDIVSEIPEELPLYEAVELLWGHKAVNKDILVLAECLNRLNQFTPAGDMWGSLEAFDYLEEQELIAPGEYWQSMTFFVLRERLSIPGAYPGLLEDFIKNWLECGLHSGTLIGYLHINRIFPEGQPKGTKWNIALLMSCCSDLDFSELLQSVKDKIDNGTIDTSPNSHGISVLLNIIRQNGPYSRQALDLFVTYYWKVRKIDSGQIAGLLNRGGIPAPEGYRQKGSLRWSGEGVENRLLEIGEKSLDVISIENFAKKQNSAQQVSEFAKQWIEGGNSYRKLSTEGKKMTGHLSLDGSSGLCRLSLVVKETGVEILFEESPDELKKRYREAFINKESSKVDEAAFQLIFRALLGEDAALKSYVEALSESGRKLPDIATKLKKHSVIISVKYGVEKKNKGRAGTSIWCPDNLRKVLGRSK